MKGIINFIVNDNRQKIAIANIQIHILTSILSSLGGPKQPKKVEWFLSWDMKVEPKKHFNCLNWIKQDSDFINQPTDPL